MTETGDERTFTLADLGEGLTEAQVVKVLVNTGDEVRRFDPVLEIETDKALTEITSPWSGVVTSVLVEEGAWVEVGAPLMVVTVK